MCVGNIEIGVVVVGHDFLNPIEISAAFSVGTVLLKLAMLTEDQWLLVAEHLYIATMPTLKVSLGVLLLRFIMERWQKKVVWITITLSTVYSIGYFFVNLFQCGYFANIQEYLQKKQNNQCLGEPQILGMTYTFSAVNAVTDWVLTGIPFLVLRKTHMNSKQKATVGFILLLGATSSIASVVRFKFIPNITAPTLSFFRTAAELGQWSVVEPGLGILAGCLMTMRPLFKRFLETARSLRNGSSAQRSQGTIPSGSNGTQRSGGTLPRQRQQIRQMLNPGALRPGADKPTVERWSTDDPEIGLASPQLNPRVLEALAMRYSAQPPLAQPLGPQLQHQREPPDFVTSALDPTPTPLPVQAPLLAPRPQEFNTSRLQEFNSPRPYGQSASRPRTQESNLSPGIQATNTLQQEFHDVDARQSQDLASSTRPYDSDARRF
jgi:hypothetical protein